MYYTPMFTLGTILKSLQRMKKKLQNFIFKKVVFHYLFEKNLNHVLFAYFYLSKTLESLFAF